MTILIDSKWIGGGRRVLELISLLVVVGLSIILLVQGLQITEEGLRETSPGLNVSMAWAYAAIPISSFTAMLFGIEKLIEQIYDQDFDRDSNTIEVFVTRIRKKLGQDVISTIRGLGYSLEEPVS
jgi:TRAP-type C4-dicarboxylate transport system permease small subunit